VAQPLSGWPIITKPRSLFNKATLSLCKISRSQSAGTRDGGRWSCFRHREGRSQVLSVQPRPGCALSCFTRGMCSGSFRTVYLLISRAIYLISYSSAPATAAGPPIGMELPADEAEQDGVGWLPIWEGVFSWLPGSCDPDERVPTC
jgi:hypothetical protein